MPGYILHMTSARMFLDRMEKQNRESMNEQQKNAFLVGNLLPDTVKDKKASHFRNPKHSKNMIEYPDLEMFLEKYQPILDDISCLGYYFHLYIDRKFFKEYLPRIVTFLDEAGQVVKKRDEVVWVEIRRNGERIPRNVFFSEEYYYGDYTRMNTYLAERYRLPLELDANVENPGISEVDYVDICKVMEELRGYLNVPVHEVNNVRVFDVEELLEFLERAVEEFQDNG